MYRLLSSLSTDELHKYIATANCKLIVIKKCQRHTIHTMQSYCAMYHSTLIHTIVRLLNEMICDG